MKCFLLIILALFLTGCRVGEHWTIVFEDGNKYPAKSVLINQNTNCVDQVEVTYEDVYGSGISWDSYLYSKEHYSVKHLMYNDSKIYLMCR
jgi:hypothetical protein